MSDIYELFIDLFFLDPHLSTVDHINVDDNLNIIISFDTKKINNFIIDLDDRKSKQILSTLITDITRTILRDEFDD